LTSNPHFLAFTGGAVVTVGVLRTDEAELGGLLAINGLVAGGGRLAAELARISCCCRKCCMNKSGGGNIAPAAEDAANAAMLAGGKHGKNGGINGGMANGGPPISDGFIIGGIRGGGCIAPGKEDRVKDSRTDLASCMGASVFG
jgi:hypothetical protein